MTDEELKIAVVDDTDDDRMQTVEMTASYLRSAKITHSIDCFADAKALLNAMSGSKKYNLLLSDVLMDDMDGMALAKELRNQGNDTAIVFISSSQEMARRGYQVDASRYLIKPLVMEELAEALKYCYDKCNAKKEILLPTEKGPYRTSFSNIQFVEAYDRGTRFVLKDETVDTKLKFSQAEALLPNAVFLQCHRAYIVNLSLARRIRQYEFQMKSGAVVPISRYRYNEVNQQFVNFVTD